MNNGKFFIGFALGTLAGGMMACFAHSSRGRKLRMDLHNTLQDLHTKGCCCKESYISEEVPQPDDVIEVVAGKVNTAEGKPTD
ncbi:MAG: YtxH domain-containing protein [Bacteroides sp.]|nr:YtxH domain-containing protein [Bacteroides sp.]